jgi:hypothetical protein
MTVIPTEIGWWRKRPVLRSPYLWATSLLALGFEVYLSFGGDFSRGVNIFGNFAIAIISLVMAFEGKRENDAVGRARARREKRQRQKWKYWY